MQIGIAYTTQIKDSINTAQLFVALCNELDIHSVLFDYKEATNYNGKVLNLLIDIDGFLSPVVRQKIGMKSVIFLQTFLQFSELESCVYMDNPYMPRNMEGVHEVWCWDVLNPEETIPSVSGLFPCPIRRVPGHFLGKSVTKTLFEKKRAKNRDELEKSVTETGDDFKKSVTETGDELEKSLTENTFTVHIAEENNTNTSSSIIPLVAIKELHQKKIINATYKFHHMEDIKDNRFFKENIWNNLEADGLPIEMVHNFEYLTANTILLSHLRFTPLRFALLEALAQGVPLIHNSIVIKDLHPYLQETYYEGNDIKGICRAFSYFQAHQKEWVESVNEIQAAIEKRFGMATHKDAWKCIFALYDVQKGEEQQEEEQQEEEQEQKEKQEQKQKQKVPIAPIVPIAPKAPTTLCIAFSDMWPGFNPHSNLILDTLRHFNTTYEEIIGTYDVSHPDILIFGPYSEKWKSIPSVPKVFFSGENWTEPTDPTIALSITSSRKEDATHLRIPTWMSYIDWFSASTELPVTSEDNPIRIPLHFAMHPHPKPFQERTKFCGFVVSNPSCTFRNETFQKVNEYKKVNSGGALYNNIGGQLQLKYAGGGCGDISKYHFFSEHQFSISFENSQSPGYVTEKLFMQKWRDAFHCIGVI